MVKHQQDAALEPVRMHQALDLPRDGEVHVWSAHIPALQSWMADLTSTLDPVERLRSARFRRIQDQVRFVIARGVLRCLLAAYMDEHPAQIRFNVGKNGKPHLDMPGGTDLSFNLSHSGDMVVYAFAWKHPVGVDIEYMQEQPELHALARYVMCKQEVDVFSSLAPDKQPSAFYTLWTRKEAYLKAIGTGLALPPNEIEVSFVGADPPKLIHAKGELSPQRWHICCLEISPSYAGALVTDIKPCAIFYRPLIDSGETWEFA